jgi:hypothetical protein
MGAEARILAFYRSDPWPRMTRVLLVGPGALTVGSLVIAVSFLTHQAQRVRVDAAAVGFLLVAGGAAYTLVGMQRILRDDLVVVLRTDGLAVQVGTEETFAPWDEVEGAQWDASRRALVLECAGRAPLVLPGPFARIAGNELAQAILTAKRRVAMNLLR